MRKPEKMKLKLAVIAPILLALPASAQDKPTTAQDKPATAQDKPAPEQNKPAPAQNKRRRLPPLGLDIGVYIPTSSRTRQLFGSKWTSYGPGIGSVAAPGKGELKFEFDVLTASKGRNKAMIIPLFLEYRLPVFGGILPIPGGPPPGDKSADDAARGAGGPPSGDDKSSGPGPGGGEPPFIPYVSVGAGGYATQLKVESLGIPSKWRASFGVTAALGVSFRDRGFIEFRYRTASRVQGIDLSGGQIRFGVRF